MYIGTFLDTWLGFGSDWEVLVSMRSVCRVGQDRITICSKNNWHCGLVRPQSASAGVAGPDETDPECPRRSEFPAFPKRKSWRGKWRGQEEPEWGGNLAVASRQTRRESKEENETQTRTKTQHLRWKRVELKFTHTNTHTSLLIKHP